MNRSFPAGRLLWALFAGVAIVGCSPEILPSSGPHPALSSDQVKIFQNPPKKYEMLGIMKIPVTPEMKWDERGDSTAGFEALKSGAAGFGVELEADDVGAEREGLVGARLR